MPSQGATVGIAIVVTGAFAVLCLAYYFAYYRPHQEKRKQREERRDSNPSEWYHNGQVVFELDAVVVHRHRDGNGDNDLEGLQQREEVRSQSRGQQTSPTRGSDENRPRAPAYNPLRMHASMHSTQHALPGPPMLPPVYYIAQPSVPFYGTAIPPPPPPPPANEPALDPPKTPRRRHRGRRSKRRSRNSKVRHPSPEHATTTSDDGSNHGGSLPSDDRRGRSVSPSPSRSRSASPGQSPGASPFQDPTADKTSIASSSLDLASRSRLNDLIQHGGDTVSPARQSQDTASATTTGSDIAQDRVRDATQHRQSALETLESAAELPSLSEEDNLFNDPGTRQRQARVGRAHRRYEINQDRSTNAFMFMHPADDEPRTYESRIGRRQQRENQSATSTDSGGGSANEDENVDLVSPISITRFSTDIMGLGVGESRVGRSPSYSQEQQRQEPRLGRSASQASTGESRVGRPDSQYQPSSRESRFDEPRPQQPIPESCVGGRRRSSSRESRERPATYRESRGFPGMTGESRIGPRSSSSGQFYPQEDDNESRGDSGSGHGRSGRIQGSTTFGNLVPLQQSQSSSRTSSNGHRRSASILNNGFFNNHPPPEPTQSQGRSAVSQVSSTGAVCSYDDSDSDNTQQQRRRRATSLGGGSIFGVDTTNATTNTGGFPSGGGARD